MPVAAAGPLAEFIKEDIYVSDVTSAQVSLASEADIAAAKKHYEETGDIHLFTEPEPEEETGEEGPKRRGLFGLFKG